MKKILQVLIIIFIAKAHSQKESIIFEIPKGKTLISLRTNEVDDIIIKTGEQRIGGYYHNLTITSYDQNCKELYDVILDMNETLSLPNHASYAGTAAPYGKYFKNIDKLIDRMGNVSQYPKSEDLHKESGLNSIFKVFSDKGNTIIGPRIGRKNVKKKYDDEDLFIHTRLHSTEESTTELLKLPEFSSNKDVQSWQLGSQTPEGFYLVSKDDLNEDKNLDRYHLSHNDFSGNILKYIKLDVQLETDHFLLSKSVHGFKEDYPNYNGIPSYSGILRDVNNKFIYAYGYYTKSDRKQVRVGKIAGLYIQKFDIDGKLIWKNKYPFDKVASEYLNYRYIHLYEFSESRAFLNYSYDTKENHFSILNTDTGDLISAHRDYLDGFKENKSNSYKKEVGLLNPRYYLKKLKKRFFSSSVIKAFATHPEVKDYIESVSSENTLYFNTYYTVNDSSVILIEFNGKERTLKLQKFKGV